MSFITNNVSLFGTPSIEAFCRRGNTINPLIKSRDYSMIIVIFNNDK